MQWFSFLKNNINRRLTLSVPQFVSREILWFVWMSNIYMQSEGACKIVKPSLIKPPSITCQLQIMFWAFWRLYVHKIVWMIKAQYFQRVKSSILGCKFHLQFRKFSMFMIVSPKILNLHGSMLYCHFENNKDDTSTTGLLLPSQLFLDPLFCTWKTRLSNSFLGKNILSSKYSFYFNILSQERNNRE